MKFIIVLLFLCMFNGWAIYASELAANFVHQPIELEEHDVMKRQAQQQTTTARPQKDENHYTSVRTKNGCKLYAADVIFFKKTGKSEAGQYDTTEFSVDGPSLKSIDDGTCGNLSGTIVLDYEGPFSPKAGSEKLASLMLTFHINYSRPFGWWELSALEVQAKGEAVGSGFQETFEGNVMKTVAIGAAKKFSYACGAPPTLFYSMDEQKKTIYGVKFRDLQIQPFTWKRSPGNFTDEVDDCVPFFSIGIWMFLIVAAILLLVVFFGIGMISSLKTMDRFDDPKGKPMVINAKE